MNGHQVGGASYLSGCSVIALCVWEMRRGLVGYVRLGVDQTITEKKSHFWKSLWALLGVRVALSMAHHPQTDGQTEHAHRTLEQTLRCVLADR